MSDVPLLNIKKPRPKVIVGLSGGVDSAVSALLLQEQGYNVEAVFMQNWEADRGDPFCTAEQDLSDAKAVANQLSIPLTVVNFSKAYWERVFSQCLDELQAGRTPNPDIGCNREIKFNCFYEFAQAHGADFMATGHYAQIRKSQSPHPYELLKAQDSNKDQSYFLYAIDPSVLSRVLFPIGHLLKTEVRRLAEKAKLVNAQKKDSTGICFIGERKYKQFLQEYLLSQPGPIETVDGRRIGTHDGLMFYTLGQRQGLGIGGQSAQKEAPWYVVAKDLQKRRLVVAQEINHPLLMRKQLVCTQMRWLSNPADMDPALALTAKTRYRQPDQRCTLRPVAEDRFEVIFEEVQRAITPGQSVVFYHQTRCLGGGIIE